MREEDEEEEGVWIYHLDTAAAALYTVRTNSY